MYFSLSLCQLLFSLSFALFFLLEAESSPPRFRSSRRSLLDTRRRLEDDYYYNYLYGTHDDDIYYVKESDEPDDTLQEEASLWDDQNTTEYGRSSFSGFLDTTPRNWGAAHWVMVISLVLLSSIFLSWLRKMPGMGEQAEQKEGKMCSGDKVQESGAPQGLDKGIAEYIAM